MTSKGTEKWEVRPQQQATITPQPMITAPKPSKPVDLTRNKQMATRAKLSVTHGRSQKLFQNWLLRDFVDQAEADRAVRMLEVCAEVSSTDITQFGDWDALAHCMAWSIMYDQTDWFLHHSGFVPDMSILMPNLIMQREFGSRFVGNPFIERFDDYGDAMLVGSAPY